MCLLSFEEFLDIFISSFLTLNTQILTHFMYTHVTDIFFINFFHSSFLSLLFLIPVFYAHVALFMMPALFHHETIFFIKMFSISLCIFCISLFITLHMGLPLLWHFFYVDVYAPIKICFEPKLEEFIFFSWKFLFLCVGIWQLPILLLVISNIQRIPTWILTKYRHIHMLMGLIIIPLLIPPDVIIQCVMTLFLFILQEIYIIKILQEKNLYNRKKR